MPSQAAKLPAAAPPPVNIAEYLPQMARHRPYAPAIICPAGRDRQRRRRYVHLTYEQLDRESDAMARGLEAYGVRRGMRTVLMVRPSLEFFYLTFGLFKAGIVPVLVDPGLGLRHLKQCLAEAEPQAFIGIPAAQAARIAFGWARGSVKHVVTAGARGFWGGTTLDAVRRAGWSDAPLPMAPTNADDIAAILFTSGSTGPPKGAVYQHRHFVAQVQMIRDTYGIVPGEIDLPTFPLFALFDPALGMTTIIPEMDPTRPARVDPRNIFAAINDFGVTNMFGSPALLNTVGRYGAEHGVQLPTLRRVICAGAPVPAVVQERFLRLLTSSARIHTPYGATESLPVCSVDSAVLLSKPVRQRSETGGGVCIGKPVPPNAVHIIRISDAPIRQWRDAELLGVGTIGEIVVRGPTVTGSYYNRDQATALAKIRDGESIVHRMGDVGYFDDDGMLWFCGRKAHRVQTTHGTLFTVPCEAVFNTHPHVFRSALVGVGPCGASEPVLCVELEKDLARPPYAALVNELLAIGAHGAHTRQIKTFLIHPGFPVDVRHDAKINREVLARWAMRQLR